MKSILFLYFISISIVLYAQTDSIEKAVLNHKLNTNEISSEDFSSIGLRWIKTIKEIGIYPDLPLDQNGKVRYLYTNNFEQTPKEKLFNRTLEWLAINYALYPMNLYSNRDDGKIILNNSFTIDGTYSCSYTGIISFKNGKMLVEFFNINFQEYLQGHYSGDIWMPEKTTIFSINQVFPVILKNPSEWKFNLNLLSSVNKQFKKEIDNLWDCLSNYESYNTF